MAVTTQPLHPVRVFIYIISTVVQVTIEGTPLPPLRTRSCVRVWVFLCGLSFLNFVLPVNKCGVCR